MGRLAYSLRFCTVGRRHAFVDPGVVALALSQFLRAATSCGMEIVAYCFMPDHVHLLVVGVAVDADARRFVTLAKQYSGYAHSRRFGAPLWQRFAYERVLRSADAIHEAARYILNNPVRAGLVRRAEGYPYSGSSTHAVQDLLASPEGG